MIFIDTSAFFAILDSADAHHARAARFWRQCVSEGTPLMTSNYVVLESAALLQHRSGMLPLSAFRDGVLPLVKTIFVSEDEHEKAMSALLLAARRKLSLVDCSSFEIMRGHHIRQAFAFDAHFAEQGFLCVPKKS